MGLNLKNFPQFFHDNLVKRQHACVVKNTRNMIK